MWGRPSPAAKTCKAPATREGLAGIGGLPVVVVMIIKLIIMSVGLS